MCCGVVPQQPPATFTNPLAANSLMITAVCSAASSYSPNAFGSPALGATRGVDVRRDRRRTRRRPQRARDVAGLVGGASRHGIALAAREPSGFEIQLVGKFLHPVVGQRDRLRAERVRLDDVGAGLE